MHTELSPTFGYRSEFITGDVTIGFFGSYEVESDMAGCTRFWRPFTDLSNTWSGDNRHHGAEKHLFPLTYSAYQCRVQHLVSLSNSPMHTLCTYFFLKGPRVTQAMLPGYEAKRILLIWIRNSNSNAMWQCIGTMRSSLATGHCVPP